jgi:protein gp37
LNDTVRVLPSAAAACPIVRSAASIKSGTCGQTWILMAGLSDIEWTDATWNPISGCKILSPGCTNCYAMRMASRLQAMGHAAYADTTRKSGGRPVWTGVLHLNEAALDVPLRWRKPRRIFVNSMSDLFQDGVPDDSSPACGR